MPGKKCTWTEDNEGLWETECKELYDVQVGSPDENKMKYCCYCGKILEQKEYSEENEGE
jgi:hypothetical protein